MEYRNLSENGPTVSAIGFGAMGLSPGIYGAVDDSRSRQAIQTGIDDGMTLLDTADVYGDGHNERLVGQVIEGNREDLFVATKGGLVLGADDTDEVSMSPDGTPEHIHEAIDASLDRLGVDRIDLYYLHRVDPATPIEESVRAMAELVDDGKVAHLGLSAVTEEELRRANEIHPITAVQGEYSLFHRDPEQDVLPVCRELGIGFVAYSPPRERVAHGKPRPRSGGRRPPVVPSVSEREPRTQSRPRSTSEGGRERRWVESATVGTCLVT